MIFLGQTLSPRVHDYLVIAPLLASLRSSTNTKGVSTGSLLSPPVQSLRLALQLALCWAPLHSSGVNTGDIPEKKENLYLSLEIIIQEL